MPALADQAPLAVVGDRLCTELVDVTDDPACLEGTGFWAVVVPYDRAADVCPVRFSRSGAAVAGTGLAGSGREAWTSSLDRVQFEAGVEAIKERIRAGGVYQVNLTRRLSAPISGDADVAALGAALAKGNPAPYSAVVHVPSAGVFIASASPERFLSHDRDLVWSSPIKGTAETPDRFLDKDYAENVMIVDLVRNDLGRICRYGTVKTPGLLEVEHHPGLVHLVSTIRGRLADGVGWPELFEATAPAGSITGAPKLAAMDMIRALEPVPRGPYCGAVGWVDADRRSGELNVAIRTFWIDGGALHFGTGGGITIDSDPSGEWQETVLKARTLLSVASAVPEPLANLDK